MSLIDDMAKSSIILSHLRRAIADFRAGKISLQGVVNAVDALRNNLAAPVDVIEDAYLKLEIINAVRLDECRPLYDRECEEIERVLNILEADVLRKLDAVRNQDD